MGLFQHRPEDPTEWAGLPSEPWDAETETEKLLAAPSADVGLTGLLGEGSALSVSVPIEPPQPDTSSD